MLILSFPDQADNLIEYHVEDPIEMSVDNLKEDPIEDPVEDPIEDLFEDSFEDPISLDIIDDPFQDPMEAPIEDDEEKPEEKELSSRISEDWKFVTNNTRIVVLPDPKLTSLLRFISFTSRPLTNNTVYFWYFQPITKVPWTFLLLGSLHA